MGTLLLDETLNDQDGAGPNAGLIDQVVRCYHAKVKADRDLMRVIAEVDRRQAYREDGYRCTADWVTGFLGMGYKRACEFVDVAVALEQLPRLQDAYENSRIGYDHLRALTQVANADNEADLLEEAEAMTVGKTFTMVRRITNVSKEDSRFSRLEKRLDMYWDLDSRMLYLYGQLPEELGAKFEKAIDHLARALPDDPAMHDMFPDDSHEPGRTPMYARRAEALAQLADATLAEEPSRPRILVHVDAEALLTGEGNAEIEDGPTVSVETARRLFCDALVQRVLYDSSGKPVHIGRTHRTAPRWMRRLLKYRDGTCQFEQCRNRKLLQAHHIALWDKDQGNTDYDNLVLLCPVHHAFVHDNDCVVKGVPPKIWIERPNGRTIRPGPPPLRE